MKAIRRFLVFALFAALGVAAAIYVGLYADRLPQQPKKGAGRKLAVRMRAADEQPENTGPFPSRRLDSPLENGDHLAAMRPADVPTKATVPFLGRRSASLPESLDSGLPMAVVPHQRLAAQYSPPDSIPSGDEKLDKVLEYVRQGLLAQPAAPSAPAARPPAALPAAGADNVKILPERAPALTHSPAPPEPVLRPTGIPSSGASSRGNGLAKPSRPVVKADPSGSGKLAIHIQNGDLREVLDLLSEQGGLNILAGKDVQGKVSATLTDVDIQSALDAILKSTGYSQRRQGKFVFVGTAEEFNVMEQSMDRVGTRVFRPNYVTAAELKTLIQPLLTEKIGTVSISSPSEAGIAANDAQAGGDKYAGGDVVLVHDYEAVLTQIDQVVREVDIRPLQVNIEAMILSVKLADTDHFGVNFALLRDHLKFGWGSPLSALTDFKFDTGGLKFGYLDGNVGAFLDALEQISDTNVIATPHVMVLNKHRAEIQIGDMKGYVNTTVTETSSTQNVQFLETGAQLRLRPFISRDGVIRMEIHPELSDGDVKLVGQFTLPQKTVTQVTSNIMVRDGCTVVIGGLIKEQLTNATTAVPVLGSLPGIGFLFRQTTETTERHELVILVTPRIVYEPATCQEGNRAGCEFERRQAVYAENMSPLSRRHIARRYCRLARAAWTNGNRDTALRMAEMAVHFDPLNNEAIELRSAIWLEKSPADAVATGPASGESPTVDGPRISDWLLNDLRRDGPPPAPALHPFDPGQPGLHTDIIRPRQLP
jgi:type IV pilus assembly protein PilQ